MIKMGLVTCSCALALALGLAPAQAPANIRLAVSPEELSQTVEWGGNPTNQTFVVWNDGAEPVSPMYFEIEIQAGAAWLGGVSQDRGMSTGDLHAIEVLFSDMTGFDTNTYVGTIHIAASDAPNGAPIQEASLLVSVTIEAPPPPSNVQAGYGTDTEKVVLTWDAEERASRYEVFRSAYKEFDPQYAQKIDEVSTTVSHDRTAKPGLLYYYWVRSVNAYGMPGDPSLPDSGHRALAPPGGLFASAGTYANMVRVTWTGSEGADSYELHRNIDGQSPTLVFHASGTSYNDMQIEPGVKYVYRAKARTGRYRSGFSVAGVGYALAPPASVSATGGTLVNAVRVAWPASDSATAYELWRSETELTNRASLLKHTADTEHVDRDVEPGKIYYYWVKAKNATATSAFSGSGSGYAASGKVDISLWHLVVLPDAMTMGSSPGVISFRIGNAGRLPMEGADARVLISIYASSGPRLRSDDDILVGRLTRDVSLPAETSTVITLDASAISMPDDAGDYFIFAKVEPVYPSSLIDRNPASAVTMRESPVRVVETKTLPRRAVNDYLGDGISDLAVTSGGLWYIRTVDGMVITMDEPWGGQGFTPVVGDFDGDGAAELAVYGEGLWFARKLTGEVVLWGESWGGIGFRPVYGVFSGTDSAGADLAVFHEESGTWYIRTPGGKIVLWDIAFGEAGYVPVPGDYSGDGSWDLAAYHEATGNWYIRTVAGDLLLWAESWGGPGFEPVSGDYTGNGVWDMAMYYEPTGQWFIRSVAGDPIVWGEAWGGPGYKPVFGDYTGDGRSDMAVYHEASGKWFIRTVKGRLVLWDSLWGAPGYKPIGM